MNVTAPSKYYREARELSETNINCLCTFLKNEVWSEIFSETNVNEKWEKFYYTFNYYFNIYIIHNLKAWANSSVPRQLIKSTRHV
jgi:hypothetical protein